MSRRGAVLFVALCLIWGVPYLLIKVAVDGVSPAELVFGRTAVGALLVLPIAVHRGQMRGVLAKWRWLLLYTAVEIAVPWFLLSSAEQRIASSLSGLLIAAVPLVAAVMIRAGGGSERLGARGLAGLLVGLLGVAAVVGFDLGHISLIPMLEMVVVIVCYAAGPLLLSRRLGELPGLGVVSASLTVAALAYLPVAVLQRPAQLPSWQVLASLLTLGVVCTAIAFLVLFELIRELGVIRTTVVTYVNPAVAVVLGILVLHEPFTAGIALGFLLILVGSVLATARRRRPEPAGQEAATARAG